MATVTISSRKRKASTTTTLCLSVQRFRVPSLKGQRLFFSPNISMLEYSWLLLQFLFLSSSGLLRASVQRASLARMIHLRHASLLLPLLHSAQYPFCLVLSLQWFRASLE
uniref:Pyrophosphate-energized vacuolar membrane proton pump-like n=1 Tax=Rhizophora mucronata TaxID=61149 RepID=A0A2P2L8K1_RHIMU